MNDILRTNCKCCGYSMRYGAIDVGVSEFWCDECAYNLIIRYMEADGIHVQEEFKKNHTLFYTKFLYPCYRDKYYIAYLSNGVGRLKIYESRD